MVRAGAANISGVLQIADKNHSQDKNDNLNNIEWVGKLPNLRSFSLVSVSHPVEINRSNVSFLTDKKITEVRIKGHIFAEPELLESIPNLKDLTVVYTDRTKIDYEGLKKIERITIDGEPYSISISTSTEDIQKLRNRGVKVSIDPNTENKMEYIENKLAAIIDSLNITAGDTEQTKLNKIVLYILEHLNYDEEMKRKLDIKSEDVDDYSDLFYQEGALYGALELKSQICGNYSSLTSALCKRLNIESYILLSGNHSWNLVNVDGDYYYVDTTWIDSNLHLTGIIHDGKTIIENKTAEELLKSENIGFINYYMDEPLSYKDTGHQAINFPSTLIDDIDISKEKGVYHKDKDPIADFEIPTEEPAETAETEAQSSTETPEITQEIRTTEPAINDETTVISSFVETTTLVIIEESDEDIPNIKEEDTVEIGCKEIVIVFASLLL